MAIANEGTQAALQVAARQVLDSFGDARRDHRQYSPGQLKYLRETAGIVPDPERGGLQDRLGRPVPPGEAEQYLGLGPGQDPATAIKSLLAGHGIAVDEHGVARWHDRQEVPETVVSKIVGRHPLSGQFVHHTTPLPGWESSNPVPQPASATRSVYMPTQGFVAPTLGGGQGPTELDLRGSGVDVDQLQREVLTDGRAMPGPASDTDAIGA